MQDGGQMDIVLMDFAKAFDKVPHKRLLIKLIHYGIRGPLLSSIETFLTHRTQRVVVDGEASDFTSHLYSLGSHKALSLGRYYS